MYMPISLYLSKTDDYPSRNIELKKSGEIIWQRGYMLYYKYSVIFSSLKIIIIEKVCSGMVSYDYVTSTNTYTIELNDDLLSGESVKDGVVKKINEGRFDEEKHNFYYKFNREEVIQEGLDEEILERLEKVYKNQFLISTKNNFSEGSEMDYKFEFTTDEYDINFPIKITSTPILSVEENSEYRYIVKSVDENNDNVFYSAIVKPEWLSMIYNVLYGKPQQKDIGSHLVKILATDGEDTTEQSFTINVTDIPIPPKILSDCKFEIKEDDVSTCEIFAETDDGSNVIFSVISQLDWLNYSQESFKLKLLCNPVNKDVGVHIFSIIAKNEKTNKSSRKDCQIIVVNTNDQPKILSNIPESIFDGEKLEFKVEFEEDVRG